MKNIFTVLFLIMAFVTATSAQEWIKRLSDPKLSTAETGSYTFVANISVASANWTVPDTVKILAVCVDSAGTITVSTTGADSVRLKKDISFCYPVVITKIYKTGTDSLLRSGYITVYGHKKK